MVCQRGPIASAALAREVFRNGKGACDACSGVETGDPMGRTKPSVAKVPQRCRTARGGCVVVVYLVNANLFSPGPLILLLLLPLISGLVSALLLRSWWALAIAPAASIGGEILALLVLVGIPQLRGLLSAPGGSAGHHRRCGGLLFWHMGGATATTPVSHNKAPC